MTADTIRYQLLAKQSYLFQTKVIQMTQSGDVTVQSQVNKQYFVQHKIPKPQRPFI